jgi:hypothetical protein
MGLTASPQADTASPAAKNHVGCVYIAVVDRSATRTGPGAYVQRQLIYHVVAVLTRFRTGGKRVYIVQTSGHTLNIWIRVTKNRGNGKKFRHEQRFALSTPKSKFIPPAKAGGLLWTLFL